MSNESKKLAEKAQGLTAQKVGDALLNNALIIIMLVVAVYVAILSLIHISEPTRLL